MPQDYHWGARTRMDLGADIIRFRIKLAITQGRLRAQYAMGRVPVVTYSTLRTSSSAVHWALRRAVGWRAVKAHALLPQHLTMAPTTGAESVGQHGLPATRHVGDWAVMREVIAKGKPACFVIMVRDPVAVAISSFSMFSVLGRTMRSPAARARWDAAALQDEDKLQALATAAVDSQFWNLMPHWVRHDVCNALKWNVLETPFPADQGVLEVERGPWRVLVMHSDLADEAKSSALSKFVRLPDIRVIRENSSQDRGRNELATAVKRAIRLKPHAVNSLLESPYTRHFFSPPQIAEMRARWLG